jgi:hypothetical protein
MGKEKRCLLPMVALQIHLLQELFVRWIGNKDAFNLGVIINGPST